jgi:hypothetical protein
MYAGYADRIRLCTGLTAMRQISWTSGSTAARQCFYSLPLVGIFFERRRISIVIPTEPAAASANSGINYNAPASPQRPRVETELAAIGRYVS